MSYENRTLFCPTCHEDVSNYGVRNIYGNKATGEKTKDWKVAQNWSSKVRQLIPICREGHEAYWIGTTTKECPICHTVPRYGKYSSSWSSGYEGFDGLAVEYDPKTGRKFGQWSTRPENAPCKDCEDDVAQLRQFKEETLKASADLQIWMVQSYPKFYSSGEVQDYHDLESAFREMCIAVGRPAPDESPLGYLPRMEVPRGVDQRSSGRFLFTPEAARCIQAVYDAILKCLTATVKYNLEKGRSLLIQLAEGKITTGKFEAGRLRYDNED